MSVVSYVTEGSAAGSDLSFNMMCRDTAVREIPVAECNNFVYHCKDNNLAYKRSLDPRRF